MNMSHKNFDIVSFEGFVTQFMGNDTQPFVYKQSQIQLYPLTIAFDFIKAPVPLFRADYNFLLLFSEGGGVQQVDADIFELNANDVLFIRESHLNAIKSISPSTDGFFIYIDSVLLPQIFADKTLLNRFTFNPKHTVSEVEMKWLCQCCDLIMQQKNNLTYSDEIETSLLKAIILKLAETWIAAPCKPGRQSEITMLFKELLYENFMQRRDISFYADALAVSKNYLNRCVNFVTNKPPKQHINEVLINHSKVLLQDFSKDISQIAYDLNFSDPSYFGRLFRQLTKLTPSEYRNSFMQDLSGKMQKSS
ncbi:MAG: AraC family transcriptional regulator [Verrucomicrobia bacterium]|nr:AraC family transcriptional regulator [Cytophagales bacterium]